MPTSAIWHVPYQRNPFFTGREDVLATLHRALHAENSVALSHPQGISGLGGIGKTQTALEYAYRHRAEYDAVFWVRADSVISLTSSLVELARLLELPERDEKNEEIIVQAVLRWFRLHTDWLLIYDNIDDLSIAEPFLPKAGPGHLLLTTRARAFGGLAQRLDIEKMEPETGALLILHRASLLALQATLDMANPDERRIARAISEELDGLPLALDQAGAYIKEAPCPLLDYLPLYRTRRSDLLRERGSFDQDYPASVSATWSLSFEKVREAHPASTELLHFCAFLAPDAIPETMIIQGATYLPSHLQDAVIHPVEFDRITATLLAYSLLRRDATETLSIHRLVQAVLRDTMDESTRKQWAERAVRSVDTVFPEVEFSAWSQCEQYLSHALVCAELVEEEKSVFPEAGRLLNRAGLYLRERARYGEAEPLIQQGLALRQQCFEPMHLDIAQSLSTLGYLYRAQGRFTEVEPLWQQALTICEQRLGRDHPYTATSLNNLAELYSAQGKYEEALPLYQRALSIREQQLGPEHPQVAMTLNNLAALYHAQGKYEEALPLYQRALSIREQKFGEMHPDTAQSLNNLAELYRRQGKYEEAEPLYQRALSIDEQQLGSNHPDTAIDLANLALVYIQQGKYTEAEPLVKRALAIFEQQLGTRHPHTATCLGILADLYQELKEYERAEPLLKRALAIRKQTLGETHPNTQHLRQRYISLLRKTGCSDEATALETQGQLPLEEY